MNDKKLEEMSVLELKGILFELNEQIQSIQNYAKDTVLPFIQKKVQEEQERQKNKGDSK